MSSEKAWRISFVFPSAVVMMLSFSILLLCDDCPKGQFKELVAHGSMVRKSSKKSASLGWKNLNSWICALHYACSFGVELVVFNIATTYFHDYYHLSTTKVKTLSVTALDFCPLKDKSHYFVHNK